MHKLTLMKNVSYCRCEAFQSEENYRTNYLHKKLLADMHSVLQIEIVLKANLLFLFVNDESLKIKKILRSYAGVTMAQGGSQAKP